MINEQSKRKRIMYNLPVWVCLLFIVILCFLPTGFEGYQVYKESDIVKAKVLAVDNSSIIDTGIIRSGEQDCTLEILKGRFKGQTSNGVNMLNGSLEQDKMFAVGDIAYVRINYKDDSIISISMIDHYRLNSEIILAVIFIAFLVLFAGRTGIRAVLSFVMTILTLWKILVPMYLKGYNPIWIGILVTVILTIIIIALVYGFNKCCLVAVLGSLLGILVTCVLGMIFTDAFHIHGAVMTSSESLLYAGYGNLNLTQIFMASIFIGAAGAVMDLSVDLTSAMNEIVQKKPGIKPLEAIKSGMNVGRAAMGTMTTTLLFAYSGGYIALLMVFMAQGTPIDVILNYKYVSAELIHTVVGSFGLVTVAPFTALCGGLILTNEKKTEDL